MNIDEKARAKNGRRAGSLIYETKRERERGWVGGDRKVHGFFPSQSQIEMEKVKSQND